MKIFLVTSTRADFGLLKNLIFEFKKNSYFDLKIIATGTHFSKKHGFSFSEIKNHKIEIYKIYRQKERDCILNILRLEKTGYTHESSLDQPVLALIIEQVSVLLSPSQKGSWSSQSLNYVVVISINSIRYGLMTAQMHFL